MDLKVVVFNKAIEAVAKEKLGSKPYVFTYTKTVKKQDAGKTLLAFYADAFSEKGKEFWREKIAKGAITVNGKTVAPSTKLQAGWITKHTVNNKVEPEVNTKITLCYEDADLLVINKPSPLAVHPSGRFFKNTLTAILKLAFPQSDYKIVHRLDANTTGVLALAKNAKTATKLISQFEAKTASKYYLAWVEGVISQEELVIKTAIGKQKENAGSRLLNTQGQEAETLLKVLIRKDAKTLVLLQPKSGRTNQLRLHLADIKHPIIGDIGYKDASYFKHHPMVYPEDSLMLHAWKLELTHNGVVHTFVAPIPSKFGEVKMTLLHI